VSEYDVHLFVIGTGPGRTRAARVAADYGAQVMVAEEFRLGGTYVSRGCIPKKSFRLRKPLPRRIQGRRRLRREIERMSFIGRLSLSARNGRSPAFPVSMDIYDMRGRRDRPNPRLVEDAHGAHGQR
jgi:hypothetical protein